MLEFPISLEQYSHFLLGAPGFVSPTWPPRPGLAEHRPAVALRQGG